MSNVSNCSLMFSIRFRPSKLISNLTKTEWNWAKSKPNLLFHKGKSNLNIVSDYATTVTDRIQNFMMQLNTNGVFWKKTRAELEKSRTRVMQKIFSDVLLSFFARKARLQVPVLKFGFCQITLGENHGLTCKISLKLDSNSSLLLEYVRP